MPGLPQRKTGFLSRYISLSKGKTARGPHGTVFNKMHLRNSFAMDLACVRKDWLLRHIWRDETCKVNARRPRRMIPRGSNENEIVSGGVSTDVCNLSKPQVENHRP